MAKEDMVLLTAEDIQNILSVSESKSYEIMRMEGFPVVRIGRIKRVKQSDFFEWLDTMKNSA